MILKIILVTIFLVATLTPIYSIIRRANLRKLRLEAKKYLELTRKINEFLSKDGNSTKYQKETIEFVSILGDHLTSSS